MDCRCTLRILYHVLDVVRGSLDAEILGKLSLCEVVWAGCRHVYEARTSKRMWCDRRMKVLGVWHKLFPSLKETFLHSAVAANSLCIAFR